MADPRQPADEPRPEPQQGAEIPTPEAEVEAIKDEGDPLGSNFA